MSTPSETVSDPHLCFMAMAFLMASRSMDPNTKHGAIIVDPVDSTIISTGENNPPVRTWNFSSIPMKRPDDPKDIWDPDCKYPYMVHAEQSAIAKAARRGVSLHGMHIYITGRPCPPCLMSIINAGITRIFAGPVQSRCVDDRIERITKRLLHGRDDVEIIDVSPPVHDLLRMVASHHEAKPWQARSDATRVVI